MNIRGSKSVIGTTGVKAPYATPKIDKVAISKTETGVDNPTEFLLIVGPTTS